MQVPEYRYLQGTPCRLFKLQTNQPKKKNMMEEQEEKMALLEDKAHLFKYLFTLKGQRSKNKQRGCNNCLGTDLT